MVGFPKVVRNPEEQYKKLPSSSPGDEGRESLEKKAKA
jgi:hypothetical protein